ncbi:hypothetical protein [Dactylosporangium sp. NPDC048998]|uniref:hypothetical protein n=1 Tax=Dactylosporangium sp. NPDC048998 TaxID=3363976 RepID=UPI00371F953D
MTSRPPVAHVEPLAGALLLRTDRSPAGALRAVASALGRAHRETVIVTAPEITARDTVFDLITSVVAELEPTGDGFRLVLLGAGPDRAARQAGIRRMAWQFGARVIGSLGPVTVASDGTCVSVPESAAAAGRGPDAGRWPAGWYGFDGAGPGEDLNEPPWSPRPRWPALPMPDRQVEAVLVAHPVPAGLWLLPPGLRPGQAGVVGTLPREPDNATIFVGGCGRPVPAEEVLRAVASRRLDPASRLVLLPGAVPAGTEPGELDVLPVRLSSAVPVLGRTGWRLAPVAPGGGVAPVDAVVPVDAVGLPAVGDDQPVGPPGVPSGPFTTGRRAVPGRATVAGWSFLEGIEAFGFAPAAAGAVVEVAIGRKGFLVGGTAISVYEFADLLTAVLGPGEQPLVLTGPQGPRPAELLADLAIAWGSTVYASAGPLALTATGILLAAAGFDAYRPGSPSLPVGPVVPAGCAAVGLADLAARSTMPAPVRVTSPSEPVAFLPQPVIDGGGEAEFQAALVDALGPEFHRHATGLREARRRAGVTDDPAPELVALRACGAGVRLGVNEYLRGAGLAAPADADGRWGPPAAVIGTGAVLALGQLPVVFGPVFASAGGRADAYTPGLELTEPGFVEVQLTSTVNPAAEVEYVIWSMVARRLDATVRDGVPVAIFAPGSRFKVLDVEPVAGRSRVYLADLGAGRRAGSDELLARLRRTGPAVPVADVRMIEPIGFAVDGHPLTYQGEPGGEPGGDADRRGLSRLPSLSSRPEPGSAGPGSDPRNAPSLQGEHRTWGRTTGSSGATPTSSGRSIFT